MVNKNLDRTGRIIRFILAIMVLIYSWWASSWLALAAAIFIFYEALAGWCVIYQILGKNSCPIDQNHRQKKD